MKDIPTRFNPKDIECPIYDKWEKEGLFHASPSKKSPFTISIPPPNVTGILHMGHALNNTLQDILIRWKRMEGKEALWMPGTDHAGIATQNVVEKKLAKENKSRDDLGREDFLKEVWKWREERGSTIIHQLERLGSSCDWDRTRFTMDKGYSDAVLEVFVSLWEKKLIYQGYYIINWCPRCKTALSDEEAPHQDREGFLYYIKYPIKDSKDFITVATTRPETMLGDVAVAVNPKDKRYKALLDKKIILPLIERELIVIKDDFVDPKFGTGIVKVTPAHDPNDFDMGNRHKLEPILVMNPDGTMNKNAGDFANMDRFEAREAVLESLKERKLLEKVVPHQHAVGHCYRCNTMIEPYLSKQWFVKMKPLAKPAIDAVKTGKIKFYPKRWTKVYLNWMENIRDWCISRQIWWGHRLPVYYCKKCMEQANQDTGHKPQDTGKGVIVSKIRPEKCPACNSTNLYQDEDVLDTWFSSWLWPFATLGWPDNNKDLKFFYPTSVLVTAPEILFFWVARMIMSGMEFMKDIPFSDVYIHGTVRDATGKKMSKSLGNTIDPIEVIEEFGADALRYSLIAITSTGQDVFLSKEKFHIGRNFANKIWNASRFILMNIDEDTRRRMQDTRHKTQVTGIDKKDLSLADKWILSSLQKAIKETTKVLGSYRFNEAEAVIYEFFWHEFCDWYIEIVKPILMDTENPKKANIEKILIYILESSLKLLHPFMPFVTEEIWQNINKRENIMISSWPKEDKSLMDKKNEDSMALVKDIIVNIRNIRSDMNIPYSTRFKVYLSPLKKGIEKKVEEGIDYITHLAKLEKVLIEKISKKPKHSATAILEGFNLFIPLEGVIDVESEIKRLTKKMEEKKGFLAASEKKMKNKNFIDKAPEKIVNIEKEKVATLKNEIKRIKETLKNL
ncbi:MAG: valine--tRNA ligase [Candidatus Omnitrophota bacterium]